MIKVLLFAGLQEKAGKGQVTVNKESLTVTELIEEIRLNEPELELSNVMVAVNEEFVNQPEQIVKKGDTVALLPPVSGG
ncbi:molybdopterin converting factor subunit 1 [Alkalihalobacillus sp. AL-G]|uniref:molybdopterin converting factor subunit 1 n=1 Tax=Alkalihalobacillus sp. AL-G TaxID=2926399 RepID=UPI00272D5E43|nr:molybdopterin converting factor subunit 1 [Alkalihalobacillus sp. AL-G]WLD94893.1 molybdopterin converting factor subunit 1 [Alkalihalobacillus sp. AL-G]